VYYKAKWVYKLINAAVSKELQDVSLLLCFECRKVVVEERTMSKVVLRLGHASVNGT